MFQFSKIFSKVSHSSPSCCTILLNLLSWFFGAFFDITAGLSICSIVYPLSSALPIGTFSFILNFKQLSSLSLPPCFLAWFFVVIIGESHSIELFSLSTIIEGGLILPLFSAVEVFVVCCKSLEAKNSWFNASAADILLVGSFYKSFWSKSNAGNKINKYLIIEPFYNPRIRS